MKKITVFLKKGEQFSYLADDVLISDYSLMVKVVRKTKEIGTRRYGWGNSKTETYSYESTDTIAMFDKKLVERITFEEPSL